jgi:hypothetical protein
MFVGYLKLEDFSIKESFVRIMILVSLMMNMLAWVKLWMLMLNIEISLTGGFFTINNPISGTDMAYFDVTELDMRVWILAFNILRFTRVSWAWTSLDTMLVSILRKREVTV